MLPFNSDNWGMHHSSPTSSNKAPQFVKITAYPNPLMSLPDTYEAYRTNGDITKPIIIGIKQYFLYVDELPDLAAAFLTPSLDQNTIVSDINESLTAQIPNNFWSSSRIKNWFDTKLRSFENRLIMKFDDQNDKNDSIAT